MYKWMLGKLTVLLVVCFANLAFADEPPSVKFEQGALVSPTFANSQYGTSEIHTNRLCQLMPGSDFCDSNIRPSEFSILAEALGESHLSTDEYVGNVYEYVYMNIATEFRYGLGKGAYGALLDQSGTPFDQANLMVELLREGNVTAHYKVGTITLNALQFASWSGYYSTFNEVSQAVVISASAACHFFADAGIPAVINGSTKSACDYTGNLIDVKFGHIWVFSGGNYYNPSYKIHDLQKGIASIRSVMDCNTNCGTNVVGAGLNGKIHTNGVGVYAQNIDETAIQAVLTGYTQKLQTYITDNMPTASLKEVIGGKFLDRSSMLSATPSFVYPYSVQITWQEEIPDKYRTRFGVGFEDVNLLDTDGGTTTTTDDALFVDEVSGFILTVGGEKSSHEPPFNLTSQLALSPINSAYEYPIYGLATSTKYSATGRLVIELKVDHPYISNNKTYMDSEINRDHRFGACISASYGGFFGGSGTTCYNSVDPFQIDAILGRIGKGRIDRMARFFAAIGPVDIEDIDLTTPTTNPYTTIGRNYSSVSKPTYMQALSWLKDISTALEISNQTLASKTTHHHSLATHKSFLNVESNLSTSQINNNAITRKSTAFSIAALLNALEGGTVQHMNDKWAGGGVISWFKIANDNLFKFYNVGTSATERNAFKGALSNYSDEEYALLDSYFNDPVTSYNLIAPTEGDVVVSGSEGDIATLTGTPLFAYSTDAKRAAYVFSFGQKGGLDYGVENPEIQIINDFKNIKPEVIDYSVSPQDGVLSIKTTDITTGTGVFPFSLSFQREYSQKHNNSRQLGQAPGGGLRIWGLSTDEMSTGLIGKGWHHNFEISAAIENNTDVAFGEYRGLDAAAIVVTLVTLQDLHATPDFEERLAAIFTSNWLIDQITNNLAVIKTGGTVSQFSRQLDGTYRSVKGGDDYLTMSASPRKERNTDNFGPFALDWLGITMAYHNSAKEQLIFDLTPEIVCDGNPNTQFTAGNKFQIQSWVFPSGVNVSFDYFDGTETDPAMCITPEFNSKMLKSVSNNLGRRLEFEKVLDQFPFIEGAGILGGHVDDPDGYNSEHLKITDDTGRIVSFRGKFSVPDDSFEGSIESHYMKVLYPEGRAVFYDYADTILSRHQLTKIRLASPNSDPNLTFSYDEFRRIASVTDAGGRQMVYYPGKMFDEKYSRGESVDAVGNSTLSYFDEKDRLLMLIEPSYQGDTP